MITVSASQSFTAGRLAVALSYGIGSAVVLYFLMLGGRRVVAPLARRGSGLQVAMGAVMVVVALAMVGNYDVKLPEHDRQPPAQLPGQPDGEPGGHRLGAQRRSRRARRIRPRAMRRQGRGGAAAPGRSPAGSDAGLPVLGTAPEFVGNQQLVQHARRPAADPALAARPRRPRRLLDLQLHQLPAHPALPDRLGQALPQGRPDDRRRPLAGVPVREGRRQRRRRDRTQRHRLSGCPGQRPRDLERLRQPVLAGRVLHRRPGAGSVSPTSARANTARRRR